MQTKTVQLAEAGWVPEALIRWGIRRLLAQRLEEARRQSVEDWVEAMRRAPIAPAPRESNEQHYEVPTRFYQLVLGEHMKYSSCLFEAGTESLDAAEAAMLERTCERAQLVDGQEILELGCGWGSLTLWLAERFPNSRIHAVSHSSSQRPYIEQQARERGLSNITVQTTDVAQLELERSRFDRIVSVEMFEHLRNWEAFLRRMHGWLKREGQLFLHVFCHRERAYPFETTDDPSDWMARHFFTGGMMPSRDLLTRIDAPFRLYADWEVSGRHYAKTSEAWLQNLQRHRAQVLPILAETYGAGEEERWYQRWRMFFLACAELFGYAGGQEWLVLHSRLGPV